MCLKQQKMSKLTVFTPIHKFNETYIRECNESLLKQSVPYEWVVLVNGEAISDYDLIQDLLSNNYNVRLLTSHETGSIGILKSTCCSVATGDILIELDYDDVLTDDALLEINKAFSDPEVKFVYSNCVEFKGDFSDGVSNTYSSAYGWEYRPWGTHKEQVSFPPKAHYLRYIYWAPNHVRAFRKDAYFEIGGYDRTLEAGDDHDLICRFYVKYGEKGFCHIDQVLYLYRVHSGNTCGAGDGNKNALIQVQTENNYIKYSEAMYMKWASDNGLLCLDLGGRFGSPPGYKTVDLLDADIIMDLNKDWSSIESNSVGVLRAYHIIEHLDDTIHFFNEAYRVLAPGGFLLLEVPSTTGEGAFSDPTHKKFFNKRSFEYYTNQNISKYIQPQYKGRFQKARLVEYWWDESVSVISGHLIALKGWYDSRFCGLKEI